MLIYMRHRTRINSFSQWLSGEGVRWHQPTSGVTRGGRDWGTSVLSPRVAIPSELITQALLALLAQVVFTEHCCRQLTHRFSLSMVTALPCEQIWSYSQHSLTSRPSSLQCFCKLWRREPRVMQPQKGHTALCSCKQLKCGVYDVPIKETQEG